ncbi:CheY-like chemotaxis protein [Paenibacillus anaericanus]|uniref:hypothetical protein n=1 Tax=Paenibacillus anaericanus TaxID=170367 RepID=UPI00278766DB|nr:hypothetical protein [Paenibacillus anaericanus]MDQ0089833.1 CheY-like chemotaxis protein [Paenibacillus anaericanus]
MTMDNGLNLGELITNKEYSDQNDQLINLYKHKGKKVLIFVSMHCVRCIELLPEIRTVRLPNTSVIIFSTGNQEDHEQLDDFFQRKMKIVSLTSVQMEQDFSVTTHPFFIVVDEHQQVCNKGTVYTGKDLLELVSANEGEKRKKLFSNLF